MSQCKVWLDNYNGQYYPGSQIQGKVILNFNGDTTLRGIKVRIICHEHTDWMGSESYYDTEKKEHTSRTVQFRGENDAFATELMLYGGHSGTSSLPMGQHIYPFNLTLPLNLPSTYHSDLGNVTYKLMATVDRPMALDYEDQLIFIVVSPVDLNALQRPDLLEPSSYSEDKTVCCWCCAQGPISLDVELPKRTLVPGETVNIIARLTNMSNTNIEGVNFELKQVIKCRVEEPSKEEKTINNVLLDLNEVGLGAHGEHTYNFSVMLPVNVPIPNFAQCRLFKAEYIYKLEAILPSVHSNLVVHMYPEIGNIQIGQRPNQLGGGIPSPAGNPAVPYPVGPYPAGPYPAGPYPADPYPTGPYPGGPYATNEKSGGYPSVPAVPHHPPVGGVPVYPVFAPTEPAPPSYDSLKMN